MSRALLAFTLLLTSSAFAVPDTITVPKSGLFVDGTEISVDFELDVAADGVSATIVDMNPKPFGDYAIPSQFLKGDGTLYHVKAIGEAAFKNSIGLTSVHIPSTVIDIGDFAFSNCTSLAEIELSYGIRRIGYRPFVNTMIRELELPDSLMYMDGSVGYGLANDLTFLMPSEESHYALSADGVLYDKDFHNLVSCPTRLEQVIIPNTVTNIAREAFCGCFRLQSILVPESVRSVGDGAFSCVESPYVDPNSGMSRTRLEQVVFLSRSLESVGAELFRGCSLLRGVYLCGDGIRLDGVDPAVFDGGAGAFTFFVSEDVRADLGDEVDAEGKWHNHQVGVYADKAELYFESEDQLGVKWSYRIEGNSAVICKEDAEGHPVAAIDTGISYNDYWYVYDENGHIVETHPFLQVPSSLGGFPVKKLGDYALANCRGITEIKLSDTITEIGDWSFLGCDSLIEIPLTERIQRIGRAPFSGTGITSIALPVGVMQIAGNIGLGCANLNQITADGSAWFSVVDGLLYDTDKTVLYACPAVKTSVAIPSTVRTIGEDAFNGCTRLTEIDIPAGVGAIGENAFAGCVKLSNIAIPASVEEIGDGAFSACSMLKTVHFLGDAPTLTAWDCFYEGTPTNLVTWVKADSKGWKDATAALPADGLWPASGARRSIKRPGENPSGGDPAEDDQPDEGESSGVMVDAYGVEWSYAVSDGLVTVTSVPTNTSGAVVVPSSIANFEVARIAEGAFNGCANITTVGIPASVTTIAAGAFNGCTSLEAFEVDGANGKFKAVNGVLYTKDGKALLKVPAAFTFACESTMRRNEYSLQTQSVPMVSGSGYTTWKVETGRDSIETVKMSITPRVALSTLLRGVEEIADYALTDCGFVAQGQMLDGSVALASNVVTTLSLKVNGKQIHAPIVNSQDVSQSFSGEVPAPISVGFVHMATTNTVVVADSSWTDLDGRQYAASSTTTTYLTLDGECSVPFIAPATVVKVGGHAFDGSGFTDVSCSGASTVAGAGVSLAAGAVLRGNAVADSAFTGEAAAVFDGWFVKDDGAVAGTVQVKASKKSRTGIKLTATVCPLAAKKITLKGVMGAEGVAVLKTTRGDHTLNVRLGVNALSGSFDGMTVEGSRNAFARNPTEKKCWTVALETASATGTGAALARGYSGLSISTDAKGKAKVTGILADGTKVSVSAQLVEGEGVACVPVVMSLYAGKAGGLAFLLRIDAKTGAASVSGVSKWTAPGRSSFTATLNGGIRVGVAGTKLAGENVTFAGELPDGYSLGVDDPWKGWRPKTTLKTGVLKGTITLYTAKNGRMKAVKATVSGVVVDGAGYGSAIVKNVASVPVTVHR